MQIMFIFFIGVIIFFQAFGDHFTSASEQELKQAKANCPTILQYLDLNQSISKHDLTVASSNCKQIDIQKKVFKND